MTSTLNSLKSNSGSRKKKLRKGRGIAAGQGASCGFGMRGQKSRSGRPTRPGFEGGQMPLYRRVPKLKHFEIINQKNFSIINLDKLNFYIKNPIAPEFEFYKQVNKYNQYLGSTLLFRNQINHVAFLVDDIKETCEEIKNQFPKYALNNPEQPIQVSQDKELLQFSINADLVDYEFADGVRKVPFNFIEFVERKNGRRGFEGKNAEKIFTSTKYSN